MQGVTDRTARFRTVVALVLDNNEYTFEGEIKGLILNERRGEGGFGYDPIFLPENETLTFAEMSDIQKNAISHRARAVKNWRLFCSKIHEKIPPHIICMCFFIACIGTSTGG